MKKMAAKIRTSSAQLHIDLHTVHYNIHMPHSHFGNCGSCKAKLREFKSQDQYPQS